MTRGLVRPPGNVGSEELGDDLEVFFWWRAALSGSDDCASQESIDMDLKVGSSSRLSVKGICPGLLLAAEESVDVLAHRGDVVGGVQAPDEV